MDINYRPTRVEVNLDNLKYNISNIRKKVDKDTLITAVVKSDAYGHGAVTCSRVFLENGADRLAVSTLEEGIELRKAKIESDILILNYVPENQLDQAIKYELTTTIYNLKSASQLNEKARQVGKKAKVHIKLDTGMNRLGFSAIEDQSTTEVLELSKFENLYIEGIYSHFCRADEKNKEFTELQYDRFMKFNDVLKAEGLDIKIKHISNSAGIISFPEYGLDMVRAGIILYGFYPSINVDREVINIKSVLELRSRVSHIKKLGKNVGIGYGHKYITKAEEKIATIPIGYGDGFTRLLSNRGSLYINEKRYGIVGSICMDQLMISASLDDEIDIGDDVILLSSDYEGVSADDLADILNTINYEVLTMLGRRIPRLYIKDGKHHSLIDYLLG